MMNTSGKFILNSIYFEKHEYLMRRGNISGTRGKLEQIKYIDAGGSKSTRALTRDQQYILFRLMSHLKTIVDHGEQTLTRNGTV